MKQGKRKEQPSSKTKVKARQGGKCEERRPKKIPVVRRPNKNNLRKRKVGWGQ